MPDPLTDADLSNLLELAERAKLAYAAFAEGTDTDQTDDAVDLFELHWSKPDVALSLIARLQAAEAELDRMKKVERDYCWMFGEHKNDPCPCGYKSTP